MDSTLCLQQSVISRILNLTKSLAAMGFTIFSAYVEKVIL